VAYAQIDWHDFVVVETVDFQPNETGNFPLPTTPQEVGARVVQQERFERGEPRVRSITVMRLLVETCCTNCTYSYWWHCMCVGGCDGVYVR
jgi:hypothetical protein